MYSLGIIAYELLAQERPFHGPDFRTQHLEDAPPRLDGVPASLGALAIGIDTRSGRIFTELTRLDDALAPWNTVSAVADFRTWMSIRRADASKALSTSSAMALTVPL